MWTDFDYPFRPLFHQIATQFYKANTRSFDFVHKLEEVRLAVNARAENETKGLIKDLILPGGLCSDAKLVLANALYFKGTWKTPFEKSMTRDEDFYLLNGQTVKVPFLTSYTSYEYYRACDGFKLIRLPYESGTDGKKFSMYIYLPDEKNGLETLMRKFDSVRPSLVHKKCETLQKISKTMIPKFKMVNEFKPSDIMNEMGINLPSTSDCDLTNMVDPIKSNDLFVSVIVQKSVIEVNTEGTEAAAVTYGVIEQQCLILNPPPPIIFKADHPFLFVIKEDISSAVLFVGIVRHPMAS